MQGLAGRVHPYRVVIFSVICLALILLLPKLQPVAFALFLTVVFSLALDAPVSALVRKGLNRTVSLLIVVLGFLAGLAGIVLGIVPKVAEQIQELSEKQGGLANQIAERVNSLATKLPFEVPEVRPEVFAGDKMIAYLNEFDLWETSGQALGLIVFSMFAALWAVNNPVPLQQRLLAFVVPHRRKQVAAVARSVEEKLRRWLVGQMALNLVVGLSSYVLFRALDVPFAALFAVLAAFLEMVPTIGVILSSLGPAIMLSLEDPGKLPWLLLGIVLIQQIEDRLLVPYVMRRALDIPQTILAFVMLTFGVLFGAAGLVMAVPLTAAAITIHDELVAYGQRRRNEATTGSESGTPETAPAVSPHVAEQAPVTERVPVPAQKTASESPAP